MTRRRRRPRANQPVFFPQRGEFAYLKDGRKVRVIEHQRHDGVFGATIRYQDREAQRRPDAGYSYANLRDLFEHPPTEEAEESSERGVVAPKKKPAATPRKPTFQVVNTVNTQLNRLYDFGIHAFGCADVSKARRMGCDIYDHYESTPEAVEKADREDLAGGGFGEAVAAKFHFRTFACCKSARVPKQGTRRSRRTKSTDLQAVRENPRQPLQSEPPSGRLAARRNKRQAIINNPQKEDRQMARRTAATKEAPAPTRSRGRRSAAKAEPEPKSNGGTRERMTHDDKLKLVPEIVKRLKNGETFTDIRNDPDMPSSGLRKALRDKGYDTKGNKVEEDIDISDLNDAQFLKAVVKMREEGVPWYRLELCSGASQAELKDILTEAGREDLVARQSRAEEEEEPAPKTTRKAAGRKRSAKTEEEPEAEAKPKRGRRRRPSAED